MRAIREPKITSPVISLGDSGPRLVALSALIGVAGLAAAWIIAMFVFPSDVGGMRRFMHAYLAAFCFCASIAVGALFFVILQHLTRAGWSVTIRRIAELVAIGILPLVVLYLPILISVLTGSTTLYVWNQYPGWSHGAPEVEEWKRAYLNAGFFGVRSVLYFAIWCPLAWYFLSRSWRQDQTGDVRLTKRMQLVAAPGMLLFCLAIMFAPLDWQMSLAPFWFSTIFPVYFFAGSVIGGVATITLIALLLQRSGRVTDEITVEHYHDMAKLMFTFIFFWGYIAFSQFMLIWYANIPEETFWFKIRMQPGWLAASLVLLFGHLLIPFLGMMARTVRRSRKFLLFATVYLLAIHWFDHYWLVMPQVNPEHRLFLFSPIELLAAVGVGGLFMAGVFAFAGDRPLVPLRDPRLGESLNFENL